MNVLLLYCIASVLATLGVLAEPRKDCEPILNEKLRLDIKLREAGIVPNIIPESPPNVIKVTYATAAANLGNFISPPRLVIPPIYEYEPAASSGHNYTLMKCDLDSPSAAAPVLRCQLCELCVNIKGPRFYTQTSGFTVAPYIPPAPTPRSGKHRIIFLLYKQEGYIPITRVLIEQCIIRVRFSIQSFAETYKLKLVAVNFFVTSVTDDCCNTGYNDCCTSDITCCSSNINNNKNVYPKKF